jgi:MYXO-CTERM domain-containing protein
MNKTIGFGFGLLSLVVASPALAHVDLVSPPPRLTGSIGGDELKTKPCGQNQNKRTDKVTTYAPGQKVDIKMKEYVDHTGYFAVAFDPDGDDSFIFPRPNMDKVNKDTDDPKMLFPVDGTKVLGYWIDKEKNCASQPDKTCTISITIPNVNCQTCTLQVTQFMTDKLNDGADNEYYYQCADIKIEGALMPGGGAGGGGAGGMAGASGNAGSGGTAAGAGGTSGGAAGTSTVVGGTGAGGTAPGTAGAPTAGSPSAGGAGGAGGGGPVAAPNGATQDDGSCSVSGNSRGGATLLMALGLILALGRRRR